MINSGSSCSSEENIKAKRLLSEYQDVFSLGYEDLKIYINGEFKHKIPLKPNVVSFR